MVEINYQIVNEGIKRFSKYYPDGNDWGDAMYEYHNGDYEQSQLALQFLYLANLHTSFLCNLTYPTFTTLLVYIN